MSRLDLVLHRHPGQEDGIRALAARDPSGNLKYLDWGAKMLASGQALVTEVADVVDLYHQFRGQSLGAATRTRAPGSLRVHPDVHTYRPQDLSSLRDLLIKIKRARDRKRRARERLYRIEGAVEADVVYDSPDLLVRHIKNKQASAHYGLGTKWCISMLREGYFDEYESQNATFFFFERKVQKKDEFDKVALLIPRNVGRFGGEQPFQAFTSIDRQIDLLSLTRVYGPRVFDVLRQVCECSDRYPGSIVSQVSMGVASAEQLEAVFATLADGKLNPYDTERLIVSICCNDGAPWSLLKVVAEHAVALSEAARKRASARYRYHARPRKDSSREVATAVEAALSIHPQVPPEFRDTFTKKLRRRRINVSQVRRVDDYGTVGVSWSLPTRTHSLRRRVRRSLNASQLLRRAGVLERRAARIRKRAASLQQKAAAKKKKKKRPSR